MTQYVSVLQRWWINSALVIFCLVAILGTLMRYIYVTPISFLDYKHILYAHSHVAVLGWAFMLTAAAFVFFILKTLTDVHLIKYRLVGLLNLVSVLGMLIFFTLQGYGLLSICFSTLHILTSYLFCYYAFQDLKQLPRSTGKLFIQWALFWMILSTVGIWIIGPISSILGKSSAYFYMTVQFFLHFQLNGWFTYAVLGIWIYRLERNHSSLTISSTYLWTLHLSLLLTYALSITWSNPLSVVFYLNSVGVLLQAIAFYLIFKKIFQHTNPLKNIHHWTNWLFAVGILCLVVKVLVQVAVALPVVAEISYTIRNYVIGFVHLIMLGSVSLPLIAILLKENILAQNYITQKGWKLFTVGLILKILILFAQGTLLWLKKGFLPYYHELILGVTALLPAALLIVLIGQLNYKRLETITLTNTKPEKL